jgi:hypothetical protein
VWADETAKGTGHAGRLAVVCAVAFPAVPRVFKGVVVCDVSTGLEAVFVELVRGVWGLSYEAGEG